MRVLAITALSFSAAVFTAVYMLPFGWLPAAALLCAAPGAILFAVRRRWLRGLALGFAGLALGFGLCWLHGLRTTVPASRVEGQTREIRVQITAWPEDRESYVRAEARLETEDLPRLKLYLYDSSGVLAAAEPGQFVELSAKLRAADKLYGEDYKGYHAKGIYLSGSAKGEVGLKENSRSPVYWPLRLNRFLLEKIGSLFPSDTVAFFQALLLGDKTELYKDLPLHLAMSRAGLMHVVAVSGMHIAFLVGLIQTVLGKGRRSALICLALVWTFVLVTGAVPSAVRSSVMQTLLLLAPLLRRENDPLTSLSAALMLLLLQNPYAAASVSLQLSFASIAGILCFSGRLSRMFYEFLPGLRRHTIGRTAVGAVVNSLSVIPFSFPLAGIHFGSVTLLAPLTNLLCLWAVTVCFCGAWIICALGIVWPAGAACLAWLLAWLARYVDFAAGKISALPCAAVYLEGRPILLWLVLSYALFVLIHFVRRGPWFRLGLPTLLSVVGLAVLVFAVRLDYAEGPATIAALDVGQGQCLAVMSGESTLLIDCGGLGTVDDAGETAGRFLISRGRKRVDALLLTHWDSDHCNGLPMLLEMCPVRMLLVPAANESDTSLPAQILESAARHGTELVTLETDLLLEIGGIRAQIYVPEETGGNEACTASRVSVNGYDMLVTGDMSAKKERELLAKHPLEEINLYIVGHHGSKYASSAELLTSIGAETAIVSCGYNTYGHPAQETLERLAFCGYTVYRTDENGTIEIRIGTKHG